VSPDCGMISRGAPVPPLTGEAEHLSQVAIAEVQSGVAGFATVGIGIGAIYGVDGFLKRSAVALRPEARHHVVHAVV